MTQLYLGQCVFIVEPGSASVRHHEDYQRIKSLINSRERFLFGTTPWAPVFEQCQRFGTTVGMDFLLSAYYSVVALKVRGLMAFADGLELMLHCYLQDLAHHIMTPHQKKELINWVVAQSVSELTITKPDKQALRALYRCERIFQELHELCQRYQSDKIPDLESVAFILFEYIDDFETALTKAPVPAEPYLPKKPRWRRLALMGGCAVLVLGLGVFGNMWQEKAYLEGLAQRTTLSALAESQRWLDAQPDMLRFASWYEERNARFQAQYKQLHQADARRLMQLDEDLARFYTARRQAANLVEQGKSSASSQELDHYILGLSPIYARLDYIAQLVEQHDDVAAQHELHILDERLSRIVTGMMDAQAALSKRTVASSAPE